jgi:hypothetical protein
MRFFIALGVSICADIWASASLLGLIALLKYTSQLYYAIIVIGGYFFVRGLLMDLCLYAVDNPKDNKFPFIACWRKIIILAEYNFPVFS